MDIMKVIIRVFGEKALIRWAVNREGNVIHVTDDEGLTSMSAGFSTNRLIGLPIKDVFEFNPGFKINNGDKPDWSKLKNIH